MGTYRTQRNPGYRPFPFVRTVYVKNFWATAQLFLQGTSTSLFVLALLLKIPGEMMGMVSRSRLSFDLLLQQSLVTACIDPLWEGTYGMKDLDHGRPAVRAFTTGERPSMPHFGFSEEG